MGYRDVYNEIAKKKLERMNLAFQELLQKIGILKQEARKRYEERGRKKDAEEIEKIKKNIIQQF